MKKQLILLLLLNGLTHTGYGATTSKSGHVFTLSILDEKAKNEWDFLRIHGTFPLGKNRYDFFGGYDDYILSLTDAKNQLPHLTSENKLTYLGTAVLSSSILAIDIESCGPKIKDAIAQLKVALPLLKHKLATRLTACHLLTGIGQRERDADEWEPTL